VVLVASDGREWSDLDTFGVWPDDMVNAPDLSRGQSAEGNFCLDVPAAAIAGALLYVEDLNSFEDDKSYWDLGS
jgi:hypothetical protein